MYAVLPSYKIVVFTFPEEKPQVFCTCWIKDLNQMHSRLASCSAKNYASLDEVIAIVCFTDLHEIVVPPHVNK